ncbi:PAS domain S-box protein [Lusitaniella coriacea]|uniref:PAS domain S-box protein n=1 Tax=Lusitaniella coriacea TaxID=1983105 RepID=UPI003CE7DFE0
MHPALKELLLARETEYCLLDRDFRILEASTQMQQFLDCPVEESSGEDIRSWFPELFGIEEDIEEVLQGERKRFEYKAINRHNSAGELIYLDLQIVRSPAQPEHPPQLILLLEDVTDRMALEQTLVQGSNDLSLLLESLEASEDSLKKIITAINDALLVCTALGKIKTANRAARELLGYGENELIGRSLSDIIVNEAFSVSDLHQSLKDEFEASKEIEVTGLTKSGEQIAIAFSCSAIDSSIPSVPEFLYIGREISPPTD